MSLSAVWFKIEELKTKLPIYNTNRFLIIMMVFNNSALGIYIDIYLNDIRQRSQKVSEFSQWSQNTIFLG